MRDQRAHELTDDRILADLRHAWDDEDRVSVRLHAGCRPRHIYGAVDSVAATGTFAIIAGQHVPIRAIRSLRWRGHEVSERVAARAAGRVAQHDMSTDAANSVSACARSPHNEVPPDDDDFKPSPLSDAVIATSLAAVRLRLEALRPFAEEFHRLSYADYVLNAPIGELR